MEHIISIIITVSIMFTETSPKYETQKYWVINTYGEIELRYYPESVIASVSGKGGMDDFSSSGFRTLFRYISGDNANQAGISMTTPVLYNKHEDSVQMSFVLPSQYQEKQPPQPLNADIKVHSTTAFYAVAIIFGGYANEKLVKKKLRELEQFLSANNLDAAGEYEVRVYNSPFKLINRRNEVTIPIRYEE